MTYSDTLRTIILNWLGEQGYLAKGEKHKKNKPKRETTEEIDLLNTIFSSLVFLLIEKVSLLQDEYETRIKGKARLNY